MLKLKQNLILQIFFTSLIGIISFIGDKGLQNGKKEIVRAVSDNLTHALVGAVVWILVVLLSEKSILGNIRDIVICFFLSSLIDVDHFISAGSWNINDATHLNYRPFFHCTTLPITIWMIMIWISKLVHNPDLIIYAWMILASFISHHVRDGNRRGLWFWPFGSTQPIPYYLYISISMILPYFVQWIMNWQMQKNNGLSINIV